MDGRLRPPSCDSSFPSDFLFSSLFLQRLADSCQPPHAPPPPRHPRTYFQHMAALVSKQTQELTEHFQGWINNDPTAYVEINSRGGCSWACCLKKGKLVRKEYFQRVDVPAAGLNNMYQQSDDNHALSMKTNPELSDDVRLLWHQDEATISAEKVKELTRGVAAKKRKRDAPAGQVDGLQVRFFHTQPPTWTLLPVCLARALCRVSPACCCMHVPLPLTALLARALPPPPVAVVPRQPALPLPLPLCLPPRCACYCCLLMQPNVLTSRRH